jgi:hypothetical protein
MAFKKPPSERTLAELNAEIKHQSDLGGSFSQSIIRRLLREIDSRFGQQEGNKSIAQHGLARRGWIRVK